MSRQSPANLCPSTKRSQVERETSPNVTLPPSNPAIAQTLTPQPLSAIASPGNVTASAVEAHTQFQLQQLATHEDNRARKRLRQTPAINRASSMDSIGSAGSDTGSIGSASVSTQRGGKLDLYATSCGNDTYVCKFHPDMHCTHEEQSCQFQPITKKGPSLCLTNVIPTFL